VDQWSGTDDWMTLLLLR